MPHTQMCFVWLGSSSDPRYWGRRSNTDTSATACVLGCVVLCCVIMYSRWYSFKCFSIWFIFILFSPSCSLILTHTHAHTLLPSLPLSFPPFLPPSLCLPPSLLPFLPPSLLPILPFLLLTWAGMRLKPNKTIIEVKIFAAFDSGYISPYPVK